jgi:hypothetical protein
MAITRYGTADMNPDFSSLKCSTSAQSNIGSSRDIHLTLGFGTCLLGSDIEKTAQILIIGREENVQWLMQFTCIWKEFPKLLTGGTCIYTGCT